MAAQIPQWSANNISSPAMAYVSCEVGASILGGFKSLYIGIAGNVLLYSFESSVSNGVITSPVTTLFVGLASGTYLNCLGLAVGTSGSGTTAGSLVALK